MLGADEFLGHVANDVTRGSGARSAGKMVRPKLAALSADQVEAWKAYFGLADPHSIERLKSASREGPAHRKPHDRRSPKQL